jgi:hypothetical protein
MFRDVLVKPRVQSMVDSEKDDSASFTSESTRVEEEKHNDKPVDKSSYILFVLDSGLDMVDTALEKLTAEYKDIMCKSIKLEDDPLKDAKYVFAFLHLSMNISESKEKRCLELKEIYGKSDNFL